MNNAPARTTRATKPAAHRHCVTCKARLLECSADSLLAQLRDLLDEMAPPELDKPGETADEWRERHRNADRNQIVSARVKLALLVDDADGYCTMCSPRFAAIQTAYRPKK